MASMFAQDVITLKNGNDIQALVQEIGDVNIMYKKFENPNGPTAQNRARKYNFQQFQK